MWLIKKKKKYKKKPEYIAVSGAAAMAVGPKDSFTPNVAVFFCTDLPNAHVLLLLYSVYYIRDDG